MPYWWFRHVVQTPPFNKNNGALTNYGTSTSCKLVSSSFHVSSFLEIQEFYGKDKNSSKEYHPHQEHWSDNWEKAVTESKLLFQIILHNVRRVVRAHHRNSCCHVTKLRCDECIDRPGQRAEPIVPYPPPRYLLPKQQGKRTKKNINWTYQAWKVE